MGGYKLSHQTWDISTIPKISIGRCCFKHISGEKKGQKDSFTHSPGCRRIRGFIERVPHDSTQSPSDLSHLPTGSSAAPGLRLTVLQTGVGSGQDSRL